jgi:hypothetical protein
MVALVSTLNGKLSSSVVLFRELEDMIKELSDDIGAGLGLRRRIGVLERPTTNQATPEESVQVGSS